MLVRTLGGSFSVGLAVSLLAAAATFAQDSGPGPDPTTGGEQSYDVTIIRFINVSTGTFTFSAEALPEGEEATETTEGIFTAVVGTATSTGTWTAIDLGVFAIWYATASGETSRLVAIGYSTPELIAGRLTTYSSTATTRQRLRALFQSSFFFGTPAEATEEPPTDTTAN